MEGAGAGIGPVVRGRVLAKGGGECRLKRGSWMVMAELERMRYETIWVRISGGRSSRVMVGGGVSMWWMRDGQWVVSSIVSD